MLDAIVDACTQPSEEMPVGAKAHASNLSHHPFPDLTERLSMSIADRGRSRRPARCPQRPGASMNPCKKAAASITGFGN
ncbi:hypothetical protein [Sphingobium aquiterrae]|uniref:hypothetical protein n=1 Tax=Sphingobium aquiterrae TaxID=2038656 RepID=UPI0030166789